MAQRHQDKDIEKLLQEFDAQGWERIPPPGGGYLKVRCPCGGHQRSIKSTPSGGAYITNVRHWLHRQPCFKKEGGPQP